MVTNPITSRDQSAAAMAALLAIGILFVIGWLVSWQILMALGF
jgi:hypothetical protein